MLIDSASERRLEKLGRHSRDNLKLQAQTQESNESTIPQDLTRYQFDEFLLPLIPEAKPGGRPRIMGMFAVINAILFVLYTGCQWRSLPHDYPNWSTVYYYFNQWRKTGTWEAIHDHLRMQVRVNEGRHPSPSAGICDAQSVKIGNPRIETSGFNGEKLIKGRKRHILFDKAYC